LKKENYDVEEESHQMPNASRQSRRIRGQRIVTMKPWNHETTWDTNDTILSWRGRGSETNQLTNSRGN